MFCNLIKPGKIFISNFIKPFGTIFILKINETRQELIEAYSKSKMGGRTIVTYMFTTVIAVIIGLVLVNLIKPGNSISNEKEKRQTNKNLLALFKP